MTAYRVGGLISYWMLTQEETVIPRTKFQLLTSIEKDTKKVKNIVSEIYTEIGCFFKEEEYLNFDGSKPIPEDWSKYIEYDSDF